MDIPFAYSPRYTTPEPNAPVSLYDGPAIMPDGTEVPCTVFLQWLPSPAVRFRLELPSEHVSLATVNLLIQGHPVSGRVFSRTIGGEAVVAEGRCEGPEHPGHGAALRSLSFEVANLSQWDGDPVRHAREFSRNRVVLNAGGWRVTLDAVRDARQLEKQVEAAGGYAITHTGRAERLGATPFDRAMAHDLLDRLHFFLSFLQGARTGPILPVGYDESGTEVWRVWSSPRIGSWRTTDGWFAHGNGQNLSELFEGFTKRWRNERKRPFLKAAVHWYTEANRNSGGLEGALILAQAALELMSSVAAAPPGRAAERIRFLLGWLKVSPALPPHCGALNEAQTVWKYVDGPQAIATLRNGLTHVFGYRKLEHSPTLLMFEAHTLALWYLELALLRWFEYSGTYGNRLFWERGAWESEQVPWSTDKVKPRDSGD
jgi:hypothetical protein